MLEQLFASWQSMLSTYLAAPFSLAAGSVNLFTVLPTVGLILLVVGLLLVAVWREKQAVWLLPPLLVSMLAPFILGLFNNIVGWIGMLFAIVVGVILLLVWIGMIAADATRRPPIWVIGWSFVSFVVYSAIVNIAFIWGIG